jgi:chromosome segregation ATPase
MIPKKYYKYVYIAVGAALLIGAVRWMALRPIQDRELILMTEVAHAKQYAKEQGKIAAKDIKAAQEKIKNAEWMLHLKDADLARKDALIAGINTTLADLSSQYAGLKTCPEQLSNTLLQIENFKGKVSLLEGQVADYQDRERAWSDKFNGAMSMAESYRKMYNNSLPVIESLEDLNAALKRDILRRKIMGTVKSGIILAAAGWVLYSAVKK